MAFGSRSDPRGYNLSAAARLKSFFDIPCDAHVASVAPVAPFIAQHFALTNQCFNHSPSQPSKGDAKPLGAAVALSHTPLGVRHAAPP